MAPRKAPYGSWRSPIKTSDLGAGSSFPGELTLDGDDLYWLELQPESGGRYGLFRHAKGGKPTEVVPPGFNVRTLVHEYGGGSYVAAGGTVYFSNFEEQRVYRSEPGSAPTAITREGLRFADFEPDPRRRRLLAVCEDHTNSGSIPSNRLAALSLDESGESTIVEGDDFYSSPRLDPSGTKLAWISWNFPEMPWDGTELWTGSLDGDGVLESPVLVAGGRGESVLTPTWSPSGVLYFVSDRSGYWELYRWDGVASHKVSNLGADMARPHWVFGNSSYDFVSDRTVALTYCREGTWHLATLDIVNGRTRDIPTTYTEIYFVRAKAGRVFFVGGSPSQPLSVVQVRLSDGVSRVIKEPERVGDLRGYLSEPRHIQFKTSGGRIAYGFLYLPKNRYFTGPGKEKPPLLVNSHGGPTSQAKTSLNVEIQGWTSRGFAVLDVNYGGSSGYGRAYRERLTGKWGVVDVDDCCNGAQSLARKGLVDGRRLIIRGGSAGGYTTLCALAFRKVFAAGASYFGVSDAEALARETHKFELHYSDKLIAPYPEGKRVYRERSAINYPDRITAPVIFFQGLEDVVVPPSQAETMVRSLRERGVPVAYIAFAGEQHGFRKAESIERSFEAELYFYSRIFGFRLPGVVEPVEIWNLAAKGD